MNRFGVICEIFCHYAYEFQILLRNVRACLFLELTDKPLHNTFTGFYMAAKQIKPARIAVPIIRPFLNQNPVIVCFNNTIGQMLFIC